MALVDLRSDVDSLRSLTRQLIATARRPDVDKRHGIYFLSADHEFAALPRFVEREVFRETFGNDANTMVEEYGPFEDFSDFILVVDHASEEPTGVLRVIRPNPAGLKTLLDVEADPRWGKKVTDFVDYHHPSQGMAGVHDAATCAVRGQWTGAAADLKCSHALYSGLFWWSIANDIELLVGAIDEAVAGLLAAVSIPLEPLCGLPALEYLGSEATRPYVISVPEARRRMREDPAFRSLLLGDLIMEEFSFPPVDLADPVVDLHAEWGLSEQPSSSTSR